MILLDTCVWVDHLRAGNRKLQSLLQSGGGPCLFQALPEAQAAEHEEVMRVVERERLYGRGIGWIDAHLRHLRACPVPPSGARQAALEDCVRLRPRV